MQDIAPASAAAANALPIPQYLIDRLAEAVAEHIAARQGSAAPTTTWLDIPTAASHLRMSEDGLRKAAQRQQIPAYQPHGPGGRYVFDQSELDAWVRAGRLPSAETLA